MEHAIQAHAARACAAALLLAVSQHASAEYRCDAPPAAIDRRACEAAKESPQALRMFIERMKPTNLYFFDYVNEAQARAWAQKEADLLAVRYPSAPSAR